MARTQSMKDDFGVLGQTQPAHSATDGSSAFSRGVLHSWKDISKYTGRGLRTLQRYEAQLGLPVHRVAGRKHSAVMAFTDEIDHWFRTRPQGIADEAAVEKRSAEMTVDQAKQAVQKAYEDFQIALQRYLQVILAEIGLSATYPDKIVRNMASARQAYNAACKYRDRLSLDAERSKALQDLLSTLHAHLLRLEERMNIRKIPSAVVCPAVLPPSKNGTDGL